MMQSEVIDDILSVEDQAAKIVDDAEKKARENISQAHDKAAKIISESVEAVRESGKADVDSAEKLLQEHLAQYEEERERIESSENSVAPQVLERAVSRIVDRICRTEYFGENEQSF